MAHQEGGALDELVQGEVGLVKGADVGGLALDGGDDVRHIGGGLLNLLRPVPHLPIDLPEILGGDLGVVQAGLALVQQVVYRRHAARDAHNGGLQVVGQAPHHLAQEGEALLLHHTGLVVLELLHALFQLGDVLEDDHKAHGLVVHEQLGDVGDVVVLGGDAVACDGGGLLVGDGGLGLLTGVDGVENVVDGGFLRGILLLDAVGQVAVFRDAVAGGKYRGEGLIVADHQAVLAQNEVAVRDPVQHVLGGHGGDVQQVELVDGNAVKEHHQGEGHGGGGDGQVPGGEGGQHAHRHGKQAPQGEHDALLKVELAGVFKGEVEQQHKGDHKADVAVGSGEEDEGAENDLRAQDGELLVEQMVIGVGEGH